MNKFELLGRLNWLNIQYFESGACITRIIIGKKLPKKDEYESYSVSFFNTKNDNVAERLAECCKKGDYIRINGKLSKNIYNDKENKKHEKIELIGWNFKKVRWDDEENRYVDIEDDTETEDAA